MKLIQPVQYSWLQEQWRFERCQSDLATHSVGTTRLAQGNGFEKRDIQKIQALHHAHGAEYKVSSRSPVMLGRA